LKGGGGKGRKKGKEKKKRGETSIVILSLFPKTNKENERDSLQLTSPTFV